MMSFQVRAMMGAGTVVAAVAAALAIGSLPLIGGIVLCAALGYVAFAAQSRRFEDDDRLVYRPVYVRSRNVQQRIRSFDD